MSISFKEALRRKGWGLTGTGPPPTDDLTAPTKDSVFLAQLQKEDPAALDETVLTTAKICGMCLDIVLTPFA